MKKMLACCALLSLLWVGEEGGANEWECCTSFEGFYLGVNLGAIGYTPTLGDQDFWLTSGSVPSSNINILAGGQIGYDWQCGATLFGLVADANWSNAQTQMPFFQTRATNRVNDVNTMALEWFATLRGRLGMGVGSGLIYVTGGAAVTGIRTRFDNFNFSNPHIDFHRSFDRIVWGIAGSAGFEYLIWNNWSFNTEILYMVFAKAHQAITFPRSPVRFAPYPANFDFHTQALIGRIALNYRFR